MAKITKAGGPSYGPAAETPAEQETPDSPVETVEAVTAALSGPSDRRTAANKPSPVRRGGGR